jgi:hypothetical protein
MTIHIFPIGDTRQHQTETSAADCDCWCDPTIEWMDPKTGLPYDEPLVIHNAADGRDREPPVGGTTATF